MAVALKDKKASVPNIPERNWWELRRKFKQTLPSKVDPSYLQSVLAIESGAAKNLIPPLKAIGFINSEGGLLDRCNLWRSDEHYPAVCREIIQSVFPQELLDVFPAHIVDHDRERLESWFQINYGLGEKAAGAKASFFLLLCKADPAQQEQATTKVAAKGKTPQGDKPSEKKVTSRKSSLSTADVPIVEEAAIAQPPSAQMQQDQHIDVPQGRYHPHRGSQQAPQVCFNIQIHIPGEQTPEVYESIFKNIGKYVLGMNDD